MATPAPRFAPPGKGLADLPRRIFLDSCTAQTLGRYGGAIHEGEQIPEHDRIHRIPHGVANVEALAGIFRLNERALFEWIVSDASLKEAFDKHDRWHMQWLIDIADHSAICLAGDGAHGRIYRLSWAGTKEQAALPPRALDSWLKILRQSDDDLLKTLAGEDGSERIVPVSDVEPDRQQPVAVLRGKIVEGGGVAGGGGH